jgi:hypothetical protein
MNLDDGFFASPDEVVGLGSDDYGATEEQRLSLFLIQLVSRPKIVSAR